MTHTFTKSDRRLAKTIAKHIHVPERLEDDRKTVEQGPNRSKIVSTTPVNPTRHKRCSAETVLKANQQPNGREDRNSGVQS